MRGHDFNEMLKKGGNWENKIRPILERLLIKIKLENQDYTLNEGKANQRKGIDFTTLSEEPTWDPKTNSHTYYQNGKILLETTSVTEKNVPGWVYTSQADFIVHTWLNENETNLMPIGYLVKLDELRKTKLYTVLEDYVFESHWYDGHSTKTKNGNQTWHTRFALVPLEDFAEGVLYRFNPHIPNLDAVQVKITKYTGPKKTTLGDFSNA